MSEVAGTSPATIRAAARRRHCENGAHDPQRNSGSCTKMSQLMNAREREDAIWGQAAAPGLAERVGPLSGNQGAAYGSPRFHRRTNYCSGKNW